MPNYQQGKIYAIYNPNYEEVCIGSTTQPLNIRLAKHKSDYNRWKQGKDCYRTSFKLMEHSNTSIKLVEEFPCSTKEELEEREMFHIRSTKCVNKNMALTRSGNQMLTVLDALREAECAENGSSTKKLNEAPSELEGVLKQDGITQVHS